MIPRRTPLADLLPDPNHPRLPDVMTRQFFRRSTIALSQSDLTPPVDDVVRTLDEPSRIKGVQVGEVSGGTVTFEILVGGRNPIVGAAGALSGTTVYPAEPTKIYPAGERITAQFDGSAGVPTGTAHILIELEAFVVAPRTEVEPHGRDRLFPSRRDEAARINRTIAERRSNASLERVEGTVGYRVRLRKPNIRNPDPIKRIDHRFRPRRPR